MVADLLEENTISWCKEKVQGLFPEIWEEILCIKPSNLGADDLYIWAPDKKGGYSKNFGYHAAMELLKETEEVAEPRSEPPPSQSFNRNKEIWHLDTAPKIKLLLWKAAKGALPVAVNLARRNIIPDVGCVRCGLEESTEHVLYHCDFAKNFWDLAPVHRGLRTIQIANTKQGISDGNKLLSLPPVGLKNPLFSWLCAAIWSARNLKLFEGRSFSEAKTVMKVISNAKEWQEAQLFIEKQRQPMEHRNRQRTRDPECISIYTDASWISVTREAGLGWIYLDSNNRNMGRGSKGLKHIRSPLMAEALAVLEALVMGKNRGWHKAEIYSDSLNMITAITNWNLPQEIYGIINDLRKLTLHFVEVSFNFVPRNENSVAYAIAKQACGTLFFFLFCTSGTLSF